MVIQPGGQSRNMKNSGLNMSRRIRRTPFTNKVEEFGVSGFTVVNHMLLPKAFQKTVEEDYWHLKSNVQIWDVSCQRQVQIEGPDAEMLVQKMTPRFIKNMKIGKCLYVPIIAENAGLEGGVVVEKVKSMKGNEGFNAANGEYTDLVKLGVIDAAKVTRSALQNAASIAALFLTTEAVIADKPEESAPAMPGGGMDDY